MKKKNVKDAESVVISGQESAGNWCVFAQDLHSAESIKTALIIGLRKDGDVVIGQIILCGLRDAHTMKIGEI